MDRPILFSGEMVRALLDGRKTQTRRVIKRILPSCQKIEPNGPNTWAMRGYSNGWTISCPHGVPGDRLWVRETWQGQNTNSQWWHEVEKKDRPLWNWAWTNPVAPSYDATPPRWISGRFMPKMVARIWLEIISVRAEKLQELTFDAALAEGIKRSEEDDYFLAPLAGVPDYPWLHPVPAFMSLWNDINDKRGYGWEVNPWVWVIEFKAAPQFLPSGEKLEEFPY